MYSFSGIKCVHAADEGGRRRGKEIFIEGKCEPIKAQAVFMLAIQHGSQVELRNRRGTKKKRN